MSKPPGKPGPSICVPKQPKWTPMLLNRAQAKVGAFHRGTRVVKSGQKI